MYIHVCKYDMYIRMYIYIYIYIYICIIISAPELKKIGGGHRGLKYPLQLFSLFPLAFFNIVYQHFRTPDGQMDEASGQGWAGLALPQQKIGRVYII